jgi:hypothetical protein
MLPWEIRWLPPTWIWCPPLFMLPPLAIAYAPCLTAPADRDPVRGELVYQHETQLMLPRVAANRGWYQKDTTGARGLLTGLLLLFSCARCLLASCCSASQQPSQQPCHNNRQAASNPKFCVADGVCPNHALHRGGPYAQGVCMLVMPTTCIDLCHCKAQGQVWSELHASAKLRVQVHSLYDASHSTKQQHPPREQPGKRSRPPGGAA